MPKHRDFNDKDKFYATWTDAIQEWLSSFHSEFRLAWASATAVKVVAGSGATGKRVALCINGLWRYRDSNYEVTVSGGAGTKDVYAVAVSANKFSGSSPTANDPDETEYNFELRVVTSGAEPTSVAAFRKIGEVDWSGSAITALRQTMGEIQGPQLAASALSNSGDITWTREPGGAMVPTITNSKVLSKHAKLTAGKLSMTADVVPTPASQTKIAGTELKITPAVASLLIVHGTCLFELGGSATESGGVFTGKLVVDGVTQSGWIYWRKGYIIQQQAAFGGTPHQSWVVPLTAAEHTIYLTHEATITAGAGGTYKDGTGYSYLLVAS